MSTKPLSPSLLSVHALFLFVCKLTGRVRAQARPPCRVPALLRIPRLRLRGERERPPHSSSRAMMMVLPPSEAQSMASWAYSNPRR